MAPQDPRVQRTKHKLHQAFTALIAETHYRQITVHDLVQRAEISRATFYLHYADKDALLTEIGGRLIEVFEAQFQAWHMMRDAFSRESVDALFQIVADNQRLCSIVLVNMDGSIAGAQLENRLVHGLETRLYELLTADEAYEPALSVNLLCGYTAHAFAGLLRWWLQNDMPYSTEAMAQISRQLQLFGIMPFVSGATVPAFGSSML